MVDGIHRWTFSGVDMSNIKTTKDNGYIWIKIGNKQIRVKRTELPKKHDNVGDEPEVTSEIRR